MASYRQITTPSFDGSVISPTLTRRGADQVRLQESLRNAASNTQIGCRDRGPPAAAQGRGSQERTARAFSPAPPQRNRSGTSDRSSEMAADSHAAEGRPSRPAAATIFL